MQSQVEQVLRVRLARVETAVDAVQARCELEKITLPQLFEYLEEIRTIDAVSTKTIQGP